MKKRTLIISLILALILIFSIQIYKHFYEKYSLNDALVVAFLSDFINNRGDVNNYILQEQYNIDILNYQLFIELFPNKKTIKGLININGILLNQTNKIVLNFYDNYKINKLKLNNDEVAYEYKSDKIIIENFNKLNNEFLLSIDFEGSPSTTGWGAFNFDKFRNKNYVTTVNEPIFASAWFPCNDRPDDKALFEVHITNDTTYLSISNGKKINEFISSDKKTYVYRSEYPISTYLMSIYSGDYVEIQDSLSSISGKHIPLVYYVFPNLIELAKKDFEEHKDYFKIFENLFGEYPFQNDKYGIALNFFKMGAIENQTITGLGYNHITGRKYVRDLLIHELAHQWWGNSVTVKEWKDIWIFEGLASYSEALYYEKKHSFKELANTMITKREFSDKILYNSQGNLFADAIYNKGAWVFHMLRKEVGDSNFFDGLKEIAKEYKFKNLSTKKLKEFYEKISKKELKDFFKQWVLNDYTIPELEFIKKQNEQKIRIIQKNSEKFIFPLDIKLNYFDETNEIINLYINSKDTLICLKKYKTIKNIDIDPNNWLLAKIKILN